MDDIYTFSAVELNRRFLSGEISATEIAECFLKRIEKYDPRLRSFISTDPKKTLEKAKQLDIRRRRGEKLGKLAGIPIAIKDNIHVKGQKTTCASKMLSNYTATFDSTAWRLLQKEDAVFIGKTNMDEFAMGSSTEHSAYAKTINPWCLDSVPGGSSGGSAAAVAARLVPLSLGTDTGGSIRQPAAFCGIVGFKPTYGRVSRNGVVAMGSSLDQVGPLASYAEDAALAMSIIGSHCSFDSTTLFQKPQDYLSTLGRDLSGKRIGVPWQFLENLAPEISTLFKESVLLLERMGCTIHEVDLDILKYSVALYYIVSTAEASTNLACFDGVKYGFRCEGAETLEELYRKSRGEGFGHEVKKRILLGTCVLAAEHREAYYVKAQRLRTLMLQKLQVAFSQCDMIVLPTTPSCAFQFNEIQDPFRMYLQDIYTIPVNLAGLPAASVPCGFSPQNKPLGIQFIGPQKQDGEVLRFAYQFEKETKFSPRFPRGFCSSSGRPLEKDGKSHAIHVNGGTS